MTVFDPYTGVPVQQPRIFNPFVCHDESLAGSKCLEFSTCFLNTRDAMDNPSRHKESKYISIYSPHLMFPKPSPFNEGMGELSFSRSSLTLE